MERVLLPRARHTAVPAPLPVPLELSREERHRLRVARHQAFQRHQQNAVWARELMAGPSPPASAEEMPCAFAARFAGLSREGLEKRLADQQLDLAALKIDVARADEERERVEHGSDDSMAALKQLRDSEAIDAARERLVAERASAVGPTDRKPEIVRL